MLGIHQRLIAIFNLTIGREKGTVSLGRGIRKIVDLFTEIRDLNILSDEYEIGEMGESGLSPGEDMSAVTK